MSGDEFEGKEIESLIKELKSPPKRLTIAKPVVPAAAGQAAASSAAQTSSAGTTRRPTFVSEVNLPRLAGTSLRKPSPRERLLSLLKLPELPSFGPLTGLTELIKPRQVTVVRMCVGLGVLLAFAMPYWPYPKANVWWMLLYFFAVGILLVAGVWAARLTWATRLGLAHVVALSVLFFGITLAAEETIPRIACANTEVVFFCR